MNDIEKFYLNPYSSILSDGDSVYMFTDQERQLVLPKATVDKLLAVLPCCEDDILQFLSVDELMAAKHIGIIRKDIPVTNSFDSVNKGWFISKNEEYKYEELKKKTVLVLGCGGVGTHSAWAMTALGIKKIILIDDDVVSLDNLNRQLLYTKADVGKYKVSVLKKKLLEINPEVEILTYKKKVLNPEKDMQEVFNSVQKIDLVIKAVDSPSNHVQMFSDYFSNMGIPYTSGGTLGNGYVLGPTYHPDLKNTYKKNLDNASNFERIHVKGISLPMIMEKVAAEINIEALNILCNHLEEINFNEKISYKTIYKNKKLNWANYFPSVLLLIVGFYCPIVSIVALALMITMDNSVKLSSFKISLLLTGWLLNLCLFEMNIDFIFLKFMFLLLGITSMPIGIYCMLLLLPIKRLKK
ncbi:ThiF family adenylyltransferase [Enterococcus faecalis]|uniref:ThiF family adenylyltransferase n=1 Tax=Enterococcus faecalis TaxID=1351 RepID=UPI003D097442